MAVARRKDPFLNFRFLVEIDDLVVGGFSDVTGLDMEVTTDEYQEGGVNDFTHQLLKTRSHSKLVLKRGVTDSDVLWKWQQDIAQGKIKRKTVRIVVLDEEGREVLGWRFVGACPVKWSASDLQATGNQVVVETLELVHAGIRRG